MAKLSPKDRCFDWQPDRQGKKKIMEEIFIGARFEFPEVLFKKSCILVLSFYDLKYFHDYYIL